MERGRKRYPQRKEAGLQAYRREIGSEDYAGSVSSKKIRRKTGREKGV